uniref:Uncharacterized protein n=1 Tax=Phlebotomus papatasi TaxID=29031 RepID=A0A1B0DQE6_PHLPP
MECIAENCRACQIKIQRESQIFIFATTNLPDIFQETTSLDIHENDGLPRVLCSNCYGRLLEAYNFRKMCSAAALHFQQILSMDIPEEKYTPPGDLNDPLMLPKADPDDNEASDSYPEMKYSPPYGHNSPSEVSEKPFIEQKPLEVLKEDPDDDIPLSTRKTKKATKRRNKSSGSQKKKKGELPREKLNLECSLCNSKFRRKLRLEMHMRQKHMGLKPCQCKICGRGFGRITALRGHMGTQHGEKRKFPCPAPKCKKQYDTEEGLNWHMKKWHDPENPRKPPTKIWVCEVCGKECKTSCALKQHSYSHGVKRPFGCTICPLRFRGRTQLKVHMMRHEGIKNFECTVCGLRKVTAKELRVHMNTHTREITYSCEFCPHKTVNLVNMKHHVKVVHQGVRDFHCPHCERSFGKPETLKHHVMTHTGEKPHACKECGKRFIQQTALKTHMKTHLKSK